MSDQLTKVQMIKKFFELAPMGNYTAESLRQSPTLPEFKVFTEKEYLPSHYDPKLQCMVVDSETPVMYTSEELIANRQSYMTLAQMCEARLIELGYDVILTV